MYLLGLISVILWGGIAYAAYLNIQTTVNLNLAQIYTGEVQLGVVILAFALIGAITSTFEIAPMLLKSTKRNENYKQEYEKTSLKSLENSDKVKVLESKIEVLEKALKEALNKKN